MDDIGKAIENLKKKMGVTEGIKAKMDRAFKTLLEGISQVSSFLFYTKDYVITMFQFRHLTTYCTMNCL